MRLFALNLLTCSVTLALLVALALPAKRAVDTSTASNERGLNAVAAPTPRPAKDPRRVFGVYVDPWHVDDWARAIGAAPQAVAKFAAFSSRRRLTDYAAESRRIGIRRLLVSWEPWRPVPSDLGTVAQARPQPGYRNIDIASGAQDRYIISFAREVARWPGTVYLRYAHEMNGY